MLCAKREGRDEICASGRDQKNRCEFLRIVAFKQALNYLSSLKLKETGKLTTIGTFLSI